MTYKIDIDNFIRKILALPNGEDVRHLKLLDMTTTSLHREELLKKGWDYKSLVNVNITEDEISINKIKEV